MNERDYRALADLNYLAGMLQGLMATCEGDYAQGAGQAAYEAQLRLRDYIKGEDNSIQEKKQSA